MPPRLVTILLALLLPAAAAALEVSVTWSPPRLYYYPPPSDLTYEASVQAVFHGDVAMTPVDADWLTRLNDQTWRGTWLWNDTAPRAVAFAGADEDTVDLIATRQPAYPLDLAAHAVPVVALDTAPENLWSPEIGIYVWGLYENCLQRGAEWERPAAMTWYDPAGVALWSEPVGLRINGQSTRYHTRKGLRQYFDDYGAQDWLLADPFADGPGRFGRLVTKSTLTAGQLLSSSLFEPLHQDLGHLGSRHRLVALYLGGEYWGAYSLRERLDDHFVEVTHELASSGGYTLIKDDEAAEGDVQDWYEFLAAYAVPPQPYGAHAWYQDVAQRLDLGAYIDWMALNIFGASSDNGWVNNMALLRVGQGPWRYLMWDEEGLLATQNLESDHFRFYAAADAAEFNEFRPPLWSMGDWWEPHQPWRDLFRGLMQNSEFKARFSARFDTLLAGALAVDALEARLDSLAADHGPELLAHAARWNLSPASYAQAVAAARGWVAARHPIVAAQKTAFLEHFAVPVELSIFTARATDTGARLDWRTERERDNLGFQVWRSLTGPDQLALLADWRDHPELAGAPDSDTPRAYAFTDASLPAGASAWYQLRHEATGGIVTVHDWVERAGPPPLPAIRLNELMADNDHVIADEAGEFDDWLELHNPGPDPLSLAGLALSDDAQDPAPWPLPDVVLPAGGFLLVWCDEDPEQGPLHADFKLSADGEELALFLLDADDVWLVDAVTFGPQATDTAYGRLPDGDGPWQTLPGPSPGASNMSVLAAPLAATGLGALHTWPNPAGERTSVRFALGTQAAGPVTVGVYDLRGRLVRRLTRADLAAGTHTLVWDRRDADGKRAAAGIYLVRVDAGGVCRSRKLSLVR